MSDVTGTAALVCTVLGLTCSAAVLARTQQLRQALPVLLEFLLAAGLLRLTSDATWRALATAAAIVLVRKVVGIGLRAAPPTTGSA